MNHITQLVGLMLPNIGVYTHILPPKIPLFPDFFEDFSLCPA
jgi:hypothetical protein